MSTKEAHEQLVKNMRKWQKIENAAVSSTGAVIDKTDNPVIRTVMEIIQRDSNTHYQIQGMIADTLEKAPIPLTPEDCAAVWDLVEKHIEIEKSTIEMAKSCLSAIEGQKAMTVQRYLLEYLLRDEEKHDALLANLEGIKKDMYPYG
jgi:hypothetical protein